MGIRTGNPAWVDSATEVEAQANPGRKITAAKLNAIEAAIDDSAEAGHQHDARYVRTVNGIGPDGSGDVVVSGGGSATWDTLAGKPAVIAAGATAADARTAIGAGVSSFSGDYGDLTGKPTLGTAAAAATGDFATAAQGVKADSAIPSGLVDAKGDLIVATADNAVARLPAGTNGHVLTADSAEAAGVKWAAAAGGGASVPMQGGPISGRWLIPPGSYTSSSSTDLNGHTCVTPYPVERAVTISKLATRVTSAAAGATAVLALYDSTAAGLPDARIAMTGTLDVSAGGSITGDITPITLSPGLYWIAVYGTSGATFVGENHQTSSFRVGTGYYPAEADPWAYNALQLGYSVSGAPPAAWPTTPGRSSRTTAYAFVVAQ